MFFVRSKSKGLCVVLTACIIAASLPVALFAQNSEELSVYQAMQWRLIGPYRGGRVTAVAGHGEQPFTFYFGATGGGVWKTVDAGQHWTNISDEFFNTGTIGAITVAPSDADIIFVGTGESPVRGVTTSHGDGVYKSIDGGKTWEQLGLEKTMHVSKILIHPTNPDIVYVGAQGNMWGANEERGVYKSMDGGHSWQKVLFIDETTGVSFLSMDVNDPDTVYAAMWDHQRKPWDLRSGGPGSGLWKTTDGGAHWIELTEGLPEAMGKTSATVSPADPKRVWAMIEAGAGGVYRSDDAGKSWKRVNSDQVVRDRAWYYTHIFAHPTDRNTVYVLGSSMLKSVDGGVTFQGIETPHGDNHDLWVNPNRPELMVEGNDGGANVSLNGGETWSTQYNQPTGQFYRVITDNVWPYRLYGGQQDWGSVRIKSFAMDGGIGAEDWQDVGGGESAQFGFYRDAPRLIYGTSLQGAITEYDVETGALRSITPYPYYSGFKVPGNLKYRFNWNAPVVVSQHNPEVIYHGAQLVLKSTDRGTSWMELSPDLTRHEKEKLGTTGGPHQIEGAGSAYYATLMYITESPHDADVIWTGSDDGLVHVTLDGGETWQNVTPAGMPEGQVNAIDVSPHEEGVAYVAMTRYKLNDFAPYIYKTDDYGKSWKKITDGIPNDTFVRVVREDVKRRGLLFAGAEVGAFVSFNDGRKWQSLQLNLPAVPITDLRVHEDDLVAATQGRAYWILDGLQPLRQINDDLRNADMYLFEPADARRLNVGESRGDEGKNPDYGAVIYYRLSEVPEDEVTLEILDDDGNIIRRFSSEKSGDDERKSLSKGVRGPEPTVPLTKVAGQNRYAWNLSTEPLVRVTDTIRNVNSRPYRVMPGQYTVRLTANGETVSQPLRIVGHPEKELDLASWRNTEDLLKQLSNMINELHRSTNRLRSIAQQTKELIVGVNGRNVADENVNVQGRALIRKIARWEEQDPQPPLPGGFQDRVTFPSRLLSTQIFHLMGIVDQGPPISHAARERVQELQEELDGIKAEMNEILSSDLRKFNELIVAEGMDPIDVPTEENPVERVELQGSNP